MGERRLEAVVIGPGVPGMVKIRFGREDGAFVTDVRAADVPPPLRMPNSRFVAVIAGRDFVRVEPFGEAWIEVQNQIRAVLNAEWDPIGVALHDDDEYDSYIGGIHSLLAEGASTEKLASHLKSIEVERMELRGSRKEKLLAVATSLRQLQLPEL